MPQPLIVITTSPRWLHNSQPARIRPTLGRLAMGRESSTVRRTLSVSPGNTGLSQRSSSMPGEPRLAESSRTSSHIMRMAIAQLCQPLAHRPPKSESRAATSST